MSLKDIILAANDRKNKKVHVKEWNTDVWLVQMSGEEQDQFEQANRGKDGGPNLIGMRARWVAACLVDEEGNKVFDNPKDVIELGKKNASVLSRLVDEILELNKLTEEDLEEIAKN